MSQDTTQIQRRVNDALERRDAKDRRPSGLHECAHEGVIEEMRAKYNDTHQAIADIKVILAKGDGRMNGLDRRIALLEKISFSFIGTIVLGTLSAVGMATIYAFTYFSNKGGSA